MEQLETKYFSIPITLARYIILNKLERHFTVFLAIKMLLGGLFHESRLCLKEIARIAGIKDIRTIKKYFDKLVSLNFIGRNPSTRMCFVRGFARLCDDFTNQSRWCFHIPYENISKTREILISAIVDFRLRVLRWAQKSYVRKKVGSSALKNGGALPKILADLGLRSYFGLSNTQIAKLIGRSKSAANRLKIASSELGFIETRQKTEKIAKLSGVDMNLRGVFGNDPCLFIERKKDGLYLMKRLTSEIYSKLEWTKRRVKRK